MAKAFYNASLVEREHKHLCSLRNKQANVWYTTLHSKHAGDMTVALSGHKSGKRHHSGCFLCEERGEDFYQASHLCVSLTVHKRLLSDALDTYPCYVFHYSSFDSSTVEFKLYDANAVKDLFDRFDEAYQCIIPMITKFFVDWVYIDALREKNTASFIQRQMMKMIYSPSSMFYITQTRSDAPLIMQASCRH